MDDTREQIARLTRATAARERCQQHATHATVGATLARTPQVRQDWADIAREARLTRDAWDEEIRSLRRQLTTA